MNASKKRNAKVLGVFCLLLALTPVVGRLTPLWPSAKADPAFADPAFKRTWQYADLPVQQGVAQPPRSWMWGPNGFWSGNEPYAQGPNGQHLVEYFDKSRMEINDPTADPNSEWYVTNGLLVVEMMSGKIQVGNDQFQQATPADIPVAGDPATSAKAPTYASLAPYSSVNGGNSAPNLTGKPVDQGIARTGPPGPVPNLSQYATYAYYDTTFGHNIPNVFWNFMNQQGTVYQNSQYVNGLVINWVFGMGYALTEPYWIQINVGGTEKWVLMQTFQRRVLTYTPDNPPAYQVEMGNVGMTYYNWRYVTPPPAPSQPTPTPLPGPQASITIDPTKGPNNGQITVNGANFPGYAAVTINVQTTDGAYTRQMTTIGAQGNGSFQTWFTMPSDAVKVNELNVVATANGGAVKATATYTLQYSAALSVSPAEVVNGSVVTVQGSNYPANNTVKLGVYQDGASQPTWLADTRTDANGSINTTYGPITIPANSPNIGKALNVVGQASNGVKAVAPQKVTVVGNPAVQVVPSSGPVGATVTFQGQGWPANRPLSVFIQAESQQPSTQSSNQVTTNGSGSFSTSIYIDMAYGNLAGIQLVAQDPASNIQKGATYTITKSPAPPTPVPPTAPSIQVQPGVLTAGQPVTVQGFNYPAGQQVTISVVAPNVAQATVATATADGSGNFAAQFTLGTNYANSGQVTIIARAANGVSTQVVMPVTASGPPPNTGLPMTLRTQNTQGAVTTKVTGTGWPANQLVTVKVISSDKSIDQVVANTTVKADGSWGTSFPDTWGTRTGLGVYASTSDGKGGASLPLVVTTFALSSGTIYTVTGANWPPNIQVRAYTYIGGTQQPGNVPATTDASGKFTLSVNLAGVPKGKGNYIYVQNDSGTLAAQYDNY